ncbi:MAG: hypothetical protein ABW221_14980 [Vicinamibacteria bacterium]
MKFSRLAFLIPFALVGCGSPTGSSTEAVAVTHGVSFGFCLPTAYCSSRLEVSAQTAVLTYESRQRTPFVQRRALDPAQWTKIATALDPAKLRALPEVVGCPDCADGGAESVAVTFGDGQVDSVTFEYRDDVAGIEALVDALREIRTSFDPPPPAEAP